MWRTTNERLKQRAAIEEQARRKAFEAEKLNQEMEKFKKGNRFDLNIIDKPVMTKKHCRF